SAGRYAHRALVAGGWPAAAGQQRDVHGPSHGGQIVHHGPSQSAVAGGEEAGQRGLQQDLLTTYQVHAGVAHQGGGGTADGGQGPCGEIIRQGDGHRGVATRVGDHGRIPVGRVGEVHPRRPLAPATAAAAALGTHLLIEVQAVDGKSDGARAFHAQITLLV